MEFTLEKSLEILRRTPSVLESLLTGLSDDWIRNNEGKDTWNPYDILGHLVFGEKTDWIIRLRKILDDSENKTFTPFDRFAQLNEPQDIPIDDLLQEFTELRKENLEEVIALQISNSDLERIGIHPEFGTVTLAQLISTWAVHDLGHIAQISRVMAYQYKTAVGPWINYLGILQK